ncbi:response regulator [bacterium]|nr:response regulator [bacterium]
MKCKNKVLVVEDEEMLRRCICRTLKFNEFVPLEASDGKEGIEIFREFSKDIILILTDIRMPGMDGVTFIQQIRSIDPKIKIIIQSAEHQYKGFSGSDGFLLKPYTINDLIEKINNVIGVPA